MTADERYVHEVLNALPRDERLRRQIEMEVRSHIAERVERGERVESAIGQLGDPVKLAESYLAAIPLVSATFLSRAAAKLIDVALWCVVAAPFLIAARMLLGRADHPVLPAILLLVFIVLIVPGFALYTAIAEHQFSRTIGKHAMALRVVRESGGRIGFGQALVRQLPMFFEIFLIDALFALFTDRSQRAFEMVSKTRVVRALDGHAPASLPRHAVVV
jgi:uncharacterized RDD family membrane protein YckC